jgi:hypothetical protein
MKYVLKKPIEVEKFDGTDECGKRLKLLFIDSDIQTEDGPVATARWFDEEGFIVQEGEYVGLFPDGSRGIGDIWYMNEHYVEVDEKLFQDKSNVVEFAKLHKRLEDARFNFDRLQKELEQYISKNVELRNQVSVLEEQLTSMQKVLESS